MIYLIFSMLWLRPRTVYNKHSSRKLFGKWKALLHFVMYLVCCQ